MKAISPREYHILEDVRRREILDKKLGSSPVGARFKYRGHSQHSARKDAASDGLALEP